MEYSKSLSLWRKSGALARSHGACLTKGQARLLHRINSPSKGFGHPGSQSRELPSDKIGAVYQLSLRPLQLFSPPLITELRAIESHALPHFLNFAAQPPFRTLNLVCKTHLLLGARVLKTAL